MACNPTYKGKRYNSLKEVEEAIGKESEQLSKLLKQKVGEELKSGKLSEKQAKEIYEKAGIKEEKKAEPPKPPTGESKGASTSPNAEGIGLAHADTEGKRAELELAEREKWEKTTDAERNKQADDFIKAGKLPKLIEDVEKGHNPSDVEHFAMVKYAAELDAKTKEAIAVGDTDAVNKWSKEYERLAKASEAAGSRQGSDFQARKAKVVQDGSLSSFMSNMKFDNAVDELTPTQIKKAEAQFKESEAAREAAEAKTKEIEEAFEKYKAEQELNRSKGKTKGPKTKEDYVKERDAIRDRIKEKWAKAGEAKKVEIDGNEVTLSEKGDVITDLSRKMQAIAPDVKALFKSYAEEAGATVESVIKNVKQTIKESIGEDISDKEIRKVIAGDYNEKKATKNELAKQRYELTQETKLLEAIDKLENGETPKTEKAKVAKNQKLTDLRKKLADLKVAAKEPERKQERINYLKKELDRVKNRQENPKKADAKEKPLSAEEQDLVDKIDFEQKTWDTEKRVDNLEKELQRVKDRREKVTEPKAKEVLSDKEIDLGKQIKAEKEAWAKEVEPQKKLQQAIEDTQKSLDEYERRVREKDSSPKESTAVQETPELKDLRAKRDAARQKYDDFLKETKAGKYDENKKFISAAQARIKANQKEVARINDKISKGDFAPEEKPNGILDNTEFQSKNRKLYNEYLKSITDKYETKLKYERERVAEQEKNLSKAGKFWKAMKIGEATLRAVRAGFDQSVFLVQMMPYTMSHPKEAIKTLPKALATIKNAEKFNADMAKLHNGAFWELMEKSGLAMYEPHSAKAELRNELHGGDKNLLNKEITIGGKKYSVGQAFERATSTQLNTARQKLFMQQVINLYEKGITYESSPKHFEDAARVANELTGHGKSLDAIQKAAPVVNPIIWSQKMFASSLNILGLSDAAHGLVGKKGYYGNLTPEARKFALKEAARFIGMGVTIMAAWKLSHLNDDEADADFNPLSTTFGTIKSGDKSINVFGRFSGIVKGISQIAAGQRYIKDKKDVLGDKYGDKTAGDVAFSAFARGKMTPLAGLITDLAINNQEDYYTHENLLSPKAIAGRLAVPMSLQSVSSDIAKDGVVKGIAESLFKFVGGGLNDQRDYKATAEAVKAEQISDTYESEDLKNPNLKFLHDNQVKKPIVQEKGAYSVIKDSKHPDGFMTDAEYERFKKIKEKRTEIDVEKIRKSSRYPYINEQGKLAYKPGIKLTTDELEKELQIISTKATDEAKRVLNLKVVKTKDQKKEADKLSEERKKIFK
jgi:hypothetical protein